MIYLRLISANKNNWLLALTPTISRLSMDQLAGLPLSTSGDSQGESSGRSTPNSDSAPGKLFVGGLSWQTNQDKLREYFGQFGNVTDVLVMKDPITQVSLTLAPYLNKTQLSL